MSAAVKSSPAGQKSGKSKSAGKKKKSKRLYYIGVPAALLTALVIFGLMPIKGTIKYGICKVFIEQRTTYPEHLRFLSLLERPNDARIEYTLINEFGETQFNTILCVYSTDPNAGLVLSDVILNRKKLDRAELAAFNKSIPAILAYPPEIKAPLKLSEDLMDLWSQ